MAYLKRSIGTVTTRTSDSPVLTTPALGTPASGVATNLTSIPATNAANLGAGAMPATITGGHLEDLGSGAPRMVWSGWNNVNSNSAQSWQSWPLDEEPYTVDTDYMTKSGGTFTCVKAGKYLWTFNTMSNTTTSQYCHHSMNSPGNGDGGQSVMYRTHSYGLDGTTRWIDYHGTVTIPMAATETVWGQSHMDGGLYLWYGGHHSASSIIYLGPAN